MLFFFQWCLELVCHFPHEYPSVLPDIFLRAPSFSRTELKQLSDDLHMFMACLEGGELCVGPVIEWLRENAEHYLQPSNAESKPPASPQKSKEDDFSRMWIYSHHLYSKIKRKDILELSSDLNLTGFSLPGKPGVIVIEGYGSHVEDFWQRVRRWQWKRLVMKEKEDCKIVDQDIDSLRKFPNFEEKNFNARPGKGRSAHMDMGLLFQYLEEKGCGHIFHIFFGVDGKVSEPVDDN